MVSEGSQNPGPRSPQEVAMTHRLFFGLTLAFVLLAIPARADFTMCGGPCPAGNHLAGQSCSLASCPGSCPNQSICSPNTGNSFTMCGGPCPSGYYLFSVACSVTNCPGSCPNQGVCNKVQGTSFTMCGGPCPSGYYLSSVACSS